MSLEIRETLKRALAAVISRSNGEDYRKNDGYAHKHIGKFCSKTEAVANVRGNDRKGGNDECFVIDNEQKALQDFFHTRGLLGKNLKNLTIKYTPAGLNTYYLRGRS